jgi:hypothetical protein
MHSSRRLWVNRAYQSMSASAAAFAESSRRDHIRMIARVMSLADHAGAVGAPQNSAGAGHHLTRANSLAKAVLIVLSF